jgi:hypothetical protein
MKPVAFPRILFAALVVVVLVGCDENDRIVQVATEAADRQAEQSRQIADQNQTLAGATQTLIAADAQARQELIAFQKDLQAQQAEIGHQRDQLEAERRQLADARTWDSQVALAARSFGVLAACLVPIVLCWQMLRTVRQGNDDPVLTEVLITELTASQSPLLSGGSKPPAILDEPRRVPELTRDGTWDGEG